MADPDLELRGGSSFTCRAGHFPFSHFFFLPKIRGGGGQVPGPSPRSTTVNDRVTWYEINYRYAGMQVALWDFQNNGACTSPA